MNRGNSGDSLDDHKVRVDMTDTTDTEVEDDYKKKKRRNEGKEMVKSQIGLRERVEERMKQLG